MCFPLKGQDFYAIVDATKNPDGLSNHIYTGVMTLVMGVVTMVRLTRNMPRKLTDSTLYSSSMHGIDEMDKDQEHPYKLHAPAPISNTDFLAVMKRMNELEEKVIRLSQKPASMPPEKEDLLNAALARVDNLEQELTATKKVHMHPLITSVSIDRLYPTPVKTSKRFMHLFILSFL